MKYIVIYKSSKKDKEWYMCHGVELSEEKLADQLRDTYAKINPNRVYKVLSILEEANLEVVENDV
jgi:Fe2+ or Zn2+ uptake regulation protein